MIGAVVVTYNAPVSTVSACVESVLRSGGIGRLVVVDTGERRDLEAVVDDRVDVVTIPNRGFGAAANHGCRLVRRLGATAVAVLNDDVVVRPGWIDAAAPFLTGSVGVVQPVVVSPGPVPVVSSLGVGVDRYGAGSDLGRGDVPPEPGTVVQIDAFTGAAFVATGDFLDATGGFDERWFLYYEDLDLARRGAALGWEYRLVTGSVVEHAGGASTSSDPQRTRFVQERNRVWFAFRHLDLRTVGDAVWLSVRRVRHRPRTVHARALAAGVAGAPLRLVERRRSGAPTVSV